VPAEAIRFEWRVGRRDRRFFAALVCAAVVGAPAIALVAHHDAGPAASPSASCIDVAHAGVLGGGAYHYCGADAIAFCRRFAADDAVTAKCDALASALSRAAR
jgi:hypothetical protein